VSQPGSNLPDFREMQLDFTAHIRNPAINARPEGLEPRRMKIYLELLYNNIEKFLSNTFPVTRSTFTDERWEALVRDYLHRHKATSPYFLEIPQEFMEFLSSTRTGEDAHPDSDNDPLWLLEMCHYEWVELALDVADLELPWDSVDPDGDFMGSPWVVSPLLWSLGYEWPVHTIGPSTVSTLEKKPTFLIVFRDAKDKVRFLESDAPTSRFLALLGEEQTLREAIDQIAIEMPQLSAAEVETKMLATLKKLRGTEIVLGPKKKLRNEEMKNTFKGT